MQPLNANMEVKDILGICFAFIILASLVVLLFIVAFSILQDEKKERRLKVKKLELEIQVLEHTILTYGDRK